MSQLRRPRHLTATWLVCQGSVDRAPLPINEVTVIDPSQPEPADPPTPADASGADASESVGSHLGAVVARIRQAALTAGRNPDDIVLAAIAKRQPEARIDAALAAGQRVFGENRVQEAKSRWAARRPAIADLRLHLVGPLQTNKVRDAVALFDVIQTVDRPSLAKALAGEFSRTGLSRECLIQVNTGEEPQKAGVPPADLSELLVRCRDEFGLPITGLMCIPPIDENPALHFALLAELAGRHGLDVLSMGMSGDFETAIRHGATIVRVGTAVFGERAPPG